MSSISDAAVDQYAMVASSDKNLSIGNPINSSKVIVG